MGVSKDDPLFIAFLTAFAKLKEMIDDDPEGLEELAYNDDSVREVCVAVSEAACKLERATARSRETFTAPTDPDHIAAWIPAGSGYSCAHEQAGR